MKKSFNDYLSELFLNVIRLHDFLNDTKHYAINSESSLKFDWQQLCPDIREYFRFEH